MAEPILNEMTLQDAFDIHTKGKPQSFVNKFTDTMTNLEKAGFPPSTLISEINNQEAITKLQKWATTKRYKGVTTSSGMFASRLKTLINVGKPLDVVNVVSAYEAANKGKPTRFGIDKTRSKRDLILPAFDDFMLAVDDAARQIPDKEHRAFFLIKTLTGLRNPDIINLQVGRGLEAGSLYGSFDSTEGKLFGLSNKGKRINYDVGQVVQGILADLAADAEAAGRTALFSGMEGIDFNDIDAVEKQSVKVETQFRNGINPVMNRAMKARGIDIYDKKQKKVISFSVRDLRKNIFTMLTDELGSADQANQVLGHSSDGNIGLEYYKTERAKSRSKRRVSLSGLQKTPELFTSLFFEVIGQNNPAMLFGPDGYGFDETRFPTGTIVDTGVVESPEELEVKNKTKTSAAKSTGVAQESVDNLEKTIDKLQGLISRTQDLSEQAGDLTASTSKEKKQQTLINKGNDYLNSILKGGRIESAMMAVPFVAKGALSVLSKAPVAGPAIEGGLSMFERSQQPPLPDDDVVRASAQTDRYTTAQLRGATIAEKLGLDRTVGEGAATFLEMTTGLPSMLETQLDREARELGPVIPSMLREGLQRKEAYEAKQYDFGDEFGNIPDPVESEPDMAATEGFVKKNVARSQAMKNEPTSMGQLMSKGGKIPSFLHGGIVR